MRQSSSNKHNMTKKNGFLLDLTLDSEFLPSFFQLADTTSQWIFSGNQTLNASFDSTRAGLERQMVSFLDLHQPNRLNPSPKFWCNLI